MAVKKQAETEEKTQTVNKKEEKTKTEKSEKSQTVKKVKKEEEPATKVEKKVEKKTSTTVKETKKTSKEPQKETTKAEKAEKVTKNAPSKEKKTAHKAEENENVSEKSVEETLIALYKLQSIHSKMDQLRIIRGELPLEVDDLNDECQKFQTRIDKHNATILELQNEIVAQKENIKNAQSQIVKYKEQLNNVKNNREFDALSKEIEYEETEIQLCEKHIKEFLAEIDEKTAALQETEESYQTTKADLERKQNELNAIVAETEKEEHILHRTARQQEKGIDARMLAAFTRIRTSVRNGLAAVKVDRNACGGCFSKIADQRQLDIRMHKKIIVCEFCGRILVDSEIAEKALEK
ncbi:MAG: C4-type zinc ribbon domain-containing protein [Bacteroidales bacterium]|jgi:predicted  nucleic acid-binding Zn-ribbon protein|nr:C4-type zinc ribbon domain-containing protein [Bacteroidales bacterium]